MTLSREDKIRFLREATRGPDDVYALRSFDSVRDPPHYWRPVYHPLNDDALLAHLAGRIEIGSYALIPVVGAAPKVWWVAADFDGKRPGSDWEADVQRFLEFLVDTKANILVNRSRSGLGAHVRVLFREMVPAWMARRWMQAWLEEASVVTSFDNPIPTSFDRLIPPQDTLLVGFTKDGMRRPGNLIGSPMHAGLAKKVGGTLPISTDAALAGDFVPDGKHWEHLVGALERRAWGPDELLAALKDAPGKNDLVPPTTDARVARHLNVVNGSGDELAATLKWCAFFSMMDGSYEQPYIMWLALASQLHRFGEDGRIAFHAISSSDHRYNQREADRMWESTQNMPMRCDNISRNGWTCPHLGTKRCGSAAAPAYWFDHNYYEVK